MQDLRLQGGPHDGKSGQLETIVLDAWPQRIYVRACNGCQHVVQHTHHMRPASGPRRQEETLYAFDSEDAKGAIYIYGPLLDSVIEREREALAA